MTNFIELANSIEIIQNNMFRFQTVLKYYTQSKQNKILLIPVVINRLVC